MICDGIMRSGTLVMIENIRSSDLSLIMSKNSFALLLGLISISIIINSFGKIFLEIFGNRVKF